ncbi:MULTISPECIES: hypothetical protein [Ruoffia]|uniref:hypothetical protein n=1 Tax=Ruoffia TaxID=2862144 RepID=UPI0030D325C1
MNTASKSENIEALIEEVMPGSQIDKNYIYGYTQPGLMASIMYNKFQFLVASDYFIVYFTPDNLLLLTVTTLGDLSGEYAIIPIEDIEFFKAKKGFIQYKITLKFYGEKKSMILKCNKAILNMKWQKENLNHLLETNWNGFVK